MRTLRHKCVDRLGIDVKDHELKTGLHQMPGHMKAHHAKPNESYFLH